ncbi:hypothetical protein N7541_005192 [Penicillium brevicompactum]|uniref:Uncharacterized protein n=1 Tax=Penicillium brevicompactum TaxID=5074 RepID=A0A9W9REW0_PENBR|nr:hypothetical protein N7541_005192 [Penicillium brevicompactum]
MAKMQPASTALIDQNLVHDLSSYMDDVNAFWVSHEVVVFLGFGATDFEFHIEENTELSSILVL